MGGLHCIYSYTAYSFFFNIYLILAALGLSCGTRDLLLRLAGSLSWCADSRVHRLCSCGTWAPEHVGSVVAAHRLSSCGTRVQMPCGMWYLTSPTRDWTCVPCIGRRILNHWTTREVPVCSLLILKIVSLCLNSLKFNYGWDLSISLVFTDNQLLVLLILYLYFINTCSYFYYFSYFELVWLFFLLPGCLAL